MITQTVIVKESERQNIIIGRRGTYNSETIVFDLSYLVDTYGAGQAVLMVKRPTDATAYPAVTTQADDQLIWIVGDVDTSYKGHGECELYWYIGQALAKSVIFGVAILRDIGDSSEIPPDPYKPWVDELVELGAETERNAEAAAASASDAADSADAAEDAQEAAEDAQEAAEDAQEAAEAAVEHYPKIVDGYWYVWSNGEWVNTGTKAAGTDGKGISSIVSVKTSTSGNIDTYTMTVTYTDSTTETLTFTVTNGVSPAVTITPIAHGHQVTITDAEHPTGQSFDVLDGEVTEAELDGVKDTITQLDNTKAPVIVDTASGSIASFPDGADGMNIRKLVANIDPIQDLHGYDNPWPAGGGKNKFDVDKMENTSAITISNGVITVTGNSKNSGKKLSELADLTVGETYTLTATTDGDESIIYLYGTGANVTWSFGNSLTITQSHLDALVFFYGGVSGGVDQTSHISNFMIRLSSVTDATFAPYSNLCPISGRTGCEVSHSGADTSDPTVIPISWQTAAGTVYGGTLDVTSGVLTVTHTIIDMGDLSWTFSNNIFLSNAISDALPPETQTDVPDMYCSAYKVVKYSGLAGSNFALTMIFASSTARKQIWVKDSRYTDAEAFDTAVTGQKLVYPLAQPQTYQLDPVTLETLLGQNNIFADCGDVSVEYPADTKLYIQKINTPTDDDMIADAQIASGKYFIVNNSLYLSTTTILAGDPIKPGTNCTATNLAAALNALNS